jgi:protein-S-isoprenylcysteine O-methyltransferase Ste14
MYTTFELGLMNAYLFLIVYIIITVIPSVYKKKNKHEDSSQKIKRDNFFRFLYNLSSIMFILAVIVSFLAPIVFDTVFFNFGFVLWTIGIIIAISVCISWIKTSADSLVMMGMYKYSRNPMYLSFFFAYVGIVLMSNSLIFLIITIFYMIVIVLYVGYEEEFCIEKYGEKYKEYMKKTSRWIGFKRY